MQLSSKSTIIFALKFLNIGDIDFFLYLSPIEIIKVKNNDYCFLVNLKQQGIGETLLLDLHAELPRFANQKTLFFEHEIF